MPRVLITDRVTGITGYSRADFENDSGREISRAVFASEPVSSHSDLLVERLFESELTARAGGIRRDHVLAEKISAEADARTFVECLLRHHVRVSADVVGAVVHRDENVIAEHNGPAIVFAVVDFPFDGRRNDRRVRAGLNVPENVHARLHAMTGADYQTRNK